MEQNTPGEIREAQLSLLGLNCGELLECPRWHPQRKRISFVDIPTGRFFETKSGKSKITEFDTGIAPLGAALPFGRGYLLVGAEEIWAWDPSNLLNHMRIWAKIPANEGIVSNDATVHDGSVWVGRMSESEEPGCGSVWRISPESSLLVVSGLTLPNGMVLAPDRRNILLVESSHECIYSVPLEAERLTPSELEVFAELKGWTPDGIAWDAQERLWVARWGEGRVSCISDLAVGDVIAPTPQVTALAFDDSGVMYVTTAREGFSEEQRTTDVYAGSFFAHGLENCGSAELDSRV